MMIMSETPSVVKMTIACVCRAPWHPHADPVLVSLLVPGSLQWPCVLCGVVLCLGAYSSQKAGLQPRHLPLWLQGQYQACPWWRECKCTVSHCPNQDVGWSKPPPIFKYKVMLFRCVHCIWVLYVSVSVCIWVLVCECLLHVTKRKHYFNPSMCMLYTPMYTNVSETNSYFTVELLLKFN